MSLSDLASLGSFVSGVAILISLVLLYFQLRQVNAQMQQADRNQQSLMLQSRANRVVQLNLSYATNAELSQALSNALYTPDQLTAPQLVQFSGYLRAYFQH